MAANDNCGILTRALDSTDFDCSEVGANTVTLTITDVNNNVDSATATVTVMDTLNPNVLTQDITVYLDASGQASITVNDIDNGSNDNCVTLTRVLDSTNFDCSEVGANTVTLTITDVNNNVDSATATVDGTRYLESDCINTRHHNLFGCIGTSEYHSRRHRQWQQ